MAATFRFQRRIYVGMLLVLGVTSAWWMWSRQKGTAPADVTARREQPFVRLAKAGEGTIDRVLQERADLFDPAPLFVPTVRNFGQGALPPHLIKQPGQVFSDFGPSLSFAEGGLATYGAEALVTPEPVEEVLARANEVPFAGFGEAGLAAPTLSARRAFVQIKDMEDQELRRTPLMEVELPRSDFGPMEFIVAVGPAGLIGDPVLTSGSGRAEVDNFFQEYLAKTYRLGTLLAPGRYRVLVGP